MDSDLPYIVIFNESTTPILFRSQKRKKKQRLGFIIFVPVFKKIVLVMFILVAVFVQLVKVPPVFAVISLFH